MSRRLRSLVLLGAVLLFIGGGIAWRSRREPAAAVTAPVRAQPVQPPIGTAWSERGVSPGPAAPSAAEDRPQAARREGVDAANLYADAFVLFDRLTDEERKMIRNPKDEVDADKAAQLYEKIKAIMALLRAAAEADYCDWGTGEITFETALPHLARARDLAALALWAAGYRMAAEPREAIADLAARARLGHHLSDTLIGVLIAGTFENSAVNLLQSHATALDAAAAKDVRDFLAGSTLDPDIARAMQGEMTAVESWWAKVAAMNPLERGSELRKIAASGDSTEAFTGVQDLVSGLLMTPNRIAGEVAFLKDVETKAGEMMLRTEAEWQPWWKAIEADVRQRHPLVQLTLPSLSSVQRAVQHRRVERAILAAGLEVLAHGPARLAQHPDPATGGTLIYSPTSEGFDLRSTYQVKGKPVTMSFPR